MIRKGNTSDIDELGDFYDTLNDYLVKTTNYPGWIKGVYPVRQTAEDAIKEDSLYVLTKGNSIAGSVILNHTPEKAYCQAEWSIKTGYDEIMVVRTLVVHPDFMRQGIATELMRFAKEKSIQAGMKAIRLDVSIENLPAIKLYECSGYKYIGTVDLGLPYEHLKWFNLYEMILST